MRHDYLLMQAFIVRTLMRYNTNRILHPGEKIVFSARRHPLIFIKPLILIGALVLAINLVPESWKTYISAGLIGFGLPYALVVTASYIFGGVSVTNQRLLLRTGLLRNQQDQMLLHKIVSTATDGPTLRLEIAGGLQRSIYFVRDAAALRNAVDQERAQLEQI